VREFATISDRCADWGLASQLTPTGFYPGFIFGEDFDPEATYRMTVNVMQSHH
jgi:hypothetical protein